MSNQPRKHHFVPQFYLAGFTEQSSKDGDLHVLDIRQRKQWKSSPEKTAHKRDFHAVDFGPDEDPMVVEKELAKLEGRWAEILRLITDTQLIPKGELFDDLMLFIAFMAIRVPSIRNTLSKFIDGVSKDLIYTKLSSTEGRASFRKIVEEQRGQKLTDHEFDKLIAFGLSQEYDVAWDQTWHVQQMVQMGYDLAPLLSLRKWYLWKVKDDAPNLICSDSPVAPTWFPPIEWPLSPSFGTPNTIVSMPINSRIAIVSMLEEELGPIDLDMDGVAAVNSMTTMYANQLYSPNRDFTWLTKEDQESSHS